MVEPSDMALFAVVAQSASMSAAATTLKTSRQFISDRIARLEQATGLVLLDRSSRGIRLTPQGRAYAVHCEQVVSLAQKAHTAVLADSGEPAGALKISTPALWGRNILPAVIERLQQRWPKLRLEVNLDDRPIEPNDFFDVVVWIGPVHNLDARVTKVCDAVVVWVAAPSAIQTYGISPAHLLDVPAVVVYPEETWTLAQQTFQPKVKLVAGDRELAKKAAVAGLGVARVSITHCKEEFADGRLIEVFGELTRSILPVQLVSREGRRNANILAFEYEVRAVLETYPR